MASTIFGTYFTGDTALPAPLQVDPDADGRCRQQPSGKDAAPKCSGLTGRLLLTGEIPRAQCKTVVAVAYFYEFLILN